MENHTRRIIQNGPEAKDFCTVEAKLQPSFVPIEPEQQPRVASMAGHYAQAAVCPLLQLTDDELELVGYTICDALRPGIAGSLAEACRDICRKNHY